MAKVGAFLAGFAAAGLTAAAGWWFAVRPASLDAGARAASAERAVQRAKRDATEAREWAERERRRKLELEEENETLKKTAAAAPPPAPMPQPPGANTPPEQWDRRRLGQEIETLAAAGPGVVANPRYPLVVRALKTRKDEGVQLLIDVLAQGFPPEMKAACATLLGALGDPRGEKPLLDLHASAKDESVRTAALRGLAALSGEGATPTLLAAWNEPTTSSFQRRLAIRGLARRKHPVALAIVEGGAPGSTPPLRIEAMEMLQWMAWNEGWKDQALVPVFGKALLSADGDGQRRLALLALEGYWSKESAPVLDAFADKAVSTELAARARRAAAAIREGKPRPENAGVPPQTAAPAPHTPQPAPPPPAPGAIEPPEPVEDPPK